MSKLVGIWDFESSEGWEDILKEMGVGMVQRKLAAGLKPTNTIENNGNQWTFKMQSSLKNSEIHATEGVEFEETTPDDKVCKCLLTREGADKLVQEIRDPKTGNLKLKVTREVSDDKLHVTFNAGTVTCKRVFKRKV